MDPNLWAGFLSFVDSLQEFAGGEALLAEKAGEGKCSFLRVCSGYSETEIISQLEIEVSGAPFCCC